KGDVLGTASITYDGEIRATIDLIAANDVERSQTAYIFSQIKAFFSSLAFKIIIGVLVALIVLLIVIRTINVRRKRRRRGGRYRR
ncbi:MAG: D-alanyl-D-alanine carboxypeptidase, partial [Clostridia bacterium]|nr:D-alanyl-D-alanine carboxypeptidase [Clostridia bacterium]